ncbi:MAG TPA: response regulator [Acidobacteriaceae bacterium]|jgi:DNA-binding response OmpR family regulator|nr:response regulator [Acidobacteriaceae bacterium]
MNQQGTQSPGGQRILFVDDEKTVCRTLALIFESRGYQSRTAESAEDALVLMAEWIPDVAILDVGLPQMNGVALAIEIRRQYPACHILLFSGRPESAELLDDFGKGGDTFEIAAKPVHPDYLLNWVGQRLAR